MTEAPGIYKITNLLNGKVYVGSAANISKRWSRHRKDLEGREHRNKKLQAAFNKYGASAFEFSLLEKTSDLLEREQFWIDALRAFSEGYNLCPMARSSRGRTYSESEKMKRAPHMEKLRSLAQLPMAKASRARTRRKNRTLGQKLTWESVETARRDYASGNFTLASLGARFGVSPITIYDAVKGKTWKDDPNEQV